MVIFILTKDDVPLAFRNNLPFTFKNLHELQHLKHRRCQLLRVLDFAYKLAEADNWRHSSCWQWSELKRFLVPILVYNFIFSVHIEFINRGWVKKSNQHFARLLYCLLTTNNVKHWRLKRLKPIISQYLSDVKQKHDC